MAIVAALAGIGVDVCPIFVYLAGGGVEQFLFGIWLIVDGVVVCVDERHHVLGATVFRQPETDVAACGWVFFGVGDFLGGAGAGDGFALCGFERHGGLGVCGLRAFGLGVSWLGALLWAGNGGVGAGLGDGGGVRVAGGGGVVAIHGGGGAIFGLFDVPCGHCGRAVGAV